MMNEWLMTFISSFLFAAGLVISGMIDPKKVIGFLDVTGNWDPSLAFVMAGAITVNFILFKSIFKKQRPLIAKNFSLPEKKNIDIKLIVGSILFGVGWGLSGICPGPAVANIFSGHSKIFIYIAGMILGMLLFEYFNFVFLSKKEEGPL